MAIKFSNSNLSGNSFNTFGIEKFNGVDYTTTPTNVDESRSIDCSNYTPSGNGLEKRYGYNTISNFTERLQGLSTNIEKANVLNIWEYRGQYIVYVTLKHATNAYNKLLLICEEIASNELLNESNVLKEAICEEEYSYGIEFDSKFFILWANKYSVISVNSDEEFTITDVSGVAYTPTILSGLGHKDSSIVPQYIEDFNMLNNRAYFSIAVDLSGAYIYELDVINTNISILEIYSADNFTFISKEDSSYEIQVNGEVVNIGISVITYEDSELIKSIKITPEETRSEVILVDFKMTVQKEDYNIIEEMRFGCAYGSYGSKDRLFLTGNPKYPHMDFHSAEANFAEEEWLDYTYFPDTSYQAFGSSNTAIIGYGILSNGAMAIFKESKNNSENLYFRTATITTTTEEYSVVDNASGEIIKYSVPTATENFPIQQSGLSLEIDSTSKIIKYDNKLLFGTKKGIYYINLNSSTSTQTYSAHELSYFIRNDFEANTSVLDMATYKNLLFVLKRSKKGKKRVYVADSNRYSYVNEKLQYEWWVMDGIRADRLYVINDELHFSDENGLYKFMPEQYYDYTSRKVLDVGIGETVVSKEIFIDFEENVDNPLSKIVINEKSHVFEVLEDFEDKKEGYEYIKETTEFDIGSEHILYIDNAYEVIDIDMSDFANIKAKLKIKIPYESDTRLFYNVLEKQIKLYASYEYNGLVEDFIFLFEEGSNIEHEYIEDKRYIIMTPSKVYTQGEPCNHVSFYMPLDNTETVKINELYTDTSEMEFSANEMPLSEFRHYNGVWYFVGADESAFLEMAGDLKFNIAEITYCGVKVYIDNRIETISHIIVYKNEPVRAYWKSKYNALGKLDYLKTASSIHFVPMADKGGYTNIGYKTLKRSVSYQSNELHALEFDDLRFDDFTFTQEEFGRTYSAKKKIKNFSFIQLKIYSNEARNSSIASLVFRFKYTKNNKGVK